MRAAAALLALAVSLGPASSAEAVPWWLTAWRYGEVAGPAAARARLARTGVRQIVLARGGLTDPLGEGCGPEVSYDDIVPRDRAAARRHFGPHWRFPAALDGPGAVSGWVRCGGNAAAVAFVRPGLGYRFFEDGLVITLR